MAQLCVSHLSVNQTSVPDIRWSGACSQCTIKMCVSTTSWQPDLYYIGLLMMKNSPARPELSGLYKNRFRIDNWIRKFWFFILKDVTDSHHLYMIILSVRNRHSPTCKCELYTTRLGINKVPHKSPALTSISVVLSYIRTGISIRF